MNDMESKIKEKNRVNYYPFGPHNREIILKKLQCIIMMNGHIYLVIYALD